MTDVLHIYITIIIQFPINEYHNQMLNLIKIQFPINEFSIRYYYYKTVDININYL